MTDQTVTDLGGLQAPWNKEMTFQEVAYEGGYKMFRIRIKEGRRFTDLELDPDTALRFGALLKDWAGKNTGTPAE
ncbi:MAG TPA: hypothetical protein ENI72_03195 [Rhodospirillales bacterium]|nr:hypothetical protein [Rhodospirillales bacterium]